MTDADATIATNTEEMRAALLALLATQGSRSKDAIKASDMAYRAYMNSLQPHERQAVLREARAFIDQAPQGSVAKEFTVDTYEDAVKAFGTSLVQATLDKMKRNHADQTVQALAHASSSVRARP